MDLAKLVQAQRNRLAQLLLNREDLAAATAANEAEIERVKRLIAHNADLLSAVAATGQPSDPPA